MLKAKQMFLKSLREKCANTELFLICIQSESEKIRTRNNSVSGHFSRSQCCYDNTIKIFSRYPKYCIDLSSWL